MRLFCNLCEGFWVGVLTNQPTYFVATVADLGPLVLGVLDRWTPVVTILTHTLLVQIRTVPHRSKRLNEHMAHLSSWPNGFREDPRCIVCSVYV